jgi:hypothetical protein
MLLEEIIILEAREKVDKVREISIKYCVYPYFNN